MADSGKQSPLGVNVMGSLLLNEGLCINPVVTKYAGSSKDDSDYSPGDIVNNTCLKWLTYAINSAFSKSTTSPVSAGAFTPGERYKIQVVGDTDWNEAAGTAAVTYNVGSVFVAATAGSGTGSASVCDVLSATYDNMLSIGQSRIPALGNSKPPTYIVNDPSEVWGEDGDPTASQSVLNYQNQLLNTATYKSTSPNGAALPGPATSGYGVIGVTGAGQNATWYPYDTENPNAQCTQWGWVRMMALQAWNDFNWNGKAQNPGGTYEPAYKDFVTSYMTLDGFVSYSNSAIYTMRNSIEFLKGTFSNMNDLITADVAGITLSTQAFGQDLINLGKAINLKNIAGFGLPSNLLILIKENGAYAESLNLAMLSVGLTPQEINAIGSGEPATKEQEQKLYSAFLLVTDQALRDVTAPLNCRTRGLTNLADLLNVKKLFPISYTTLTVPIYNAAPGPTNSKTYYLLYVNREMNPQLLAPAIVEQVGTILPPVAEPIIEPAPVPIEPKPDIPLPFVTGRDPAPGRIGGGGGCVALESFVPLVETEQKHNGREITKAWMLESGMKISLGTDSLEIVDGSVVKTLNDYQPCVRIVTSDGITLVCSTTAPILTRDKGFIPATEVYGKRVAVMRNGKTWYDEVVGLEDVGMKFVRVIDAGNNSFWAGERPGSFILHHNVPINDKFNYDKK